MFRRRVQPTEDPPAPVPVAGFDLFVVSKDGSELTRVTDTAESEQVFGWSPDGQWIVYVQATDDATSLWVVRPDGTDRGN